MRNKLAIFAFPFMLLFFIECRATVINFEEVGVKNTYNPSTPIGFDSKGFHFSDAVSVLDVRDGSIYSNFGPAYSGNYVALNNFWERSPITITRSDVGIFDFNGLSYSNSQYSSMGYLFIVGYLNGKEVGSGAFQVNGSRLWTTIESNIRSVDTVKISLNGAATVIFDDVRVTAVPEPSEVVLLLGGLILLGFRIVKIKLLGISSKQGGFHVL